MQIVASNPLALNEASLDSGTLLSEKEIYKKELDNIDKKDDIKRNILEGKMKKFINDNTLLNQPFVKDPSTSLLKIIKDNEIISFTRYEDGEGIEKHYIENIKILKKVKFIFFEFHNDIFTNIQKSKIFRKLKQEGFFLKDKFINSYYFIKH